MNQERLKAQQDFAKLVGEGRKYAYWTEVDDEGKYRIIMVFENEPQYLSTDYKPFDDEDEAERKIYEMNVGLGIDRTEAMRIVGTSITASIREGKHGR